MPIYVMLSSLTDDGMETLHKHPERIKEVNAEVERFGVKVLHQWAVLGPYDFVNIVEAPDNETVARVSVELGARGTVKLMTMPAIPIDDFIARLKEGREKEEGDGGDTD
ncbi:hypothetical protein HRbin28_01359 [bacterium HR28]|nr:hypothetical protein HRbin28_01359 [bacterium HR28]